MLAGRILGSTAHTFRLAFVLTVVAVILVVLLKALPWDHLGEFLPRFHG